VNNNNDKPRPQEWSATHSHSHSQTAHDTHKTRSYPRATRWSSSLMP
jgi:hypothetical protein